MSGSPFLQTGYTIYENPSDVPGFYVMRGWVMMDDGTPQCALEAAATPVGAQGLEALRAILRSQGRVNMGREQNDDPVIVETWI